MKRLLLALLLLFAPAYAHATTTIQEVTTDSGIKIWLAEDHKLPLVAMQFAFRGGVEQDSADKQGLANLTTTLLTEGAGPYNAEQFQQQLADRSIRMNFNAGRDALYGGLKFLNADREKAFELLHLALIKPQFAPKEIERHKAAQLAALRSMLGNPEWQARYQLFQKIFGAHPYGERRLGTTTTLASLTREDITEFAVAHLAQDNLVVAVAGDMTAKDAERMVERVFGVLPKHAHLADIKEVEIPHDGSMLYIARDGTQSNLMFAMPGPKRDDPEWYAVDIANYILGGGGFSSRLMQDVRDKKGLTYGIQTVLSPMDHGGFIAGEMASDNPKTNEAWDVATSTIGRFYDDGVTNKEVASAKDYLTGALPLELTSTDKIAGVLVEIQLDKLGIDYLTRRNELIRSVTVDDVNKAIHDWFNPTRITLSIVGKPEGMTLPPPRPLVRE